MQQSIPPPTRQSKHITPPESIASDPDLEYSRRVSKDTQSCRERDKGHRRWKGPLHRVPAGRGLKETKLLAELAKAKGIRTIVGLQARQSALFRKVKKLVEDGKIGDILSTSMVRRPLRSCIAPFLLMVDITNIRSACALGTNGI